MDNDSHGSVALMAIQPRFAQQILDGTKRVEFRKRMFKEEVSWVLIYASTPVKRVIGWFSIDTFVQDSPCELWTRFNEVGGISETDFNNYYGVATSAVAIVVGRAACLLHPIEVKELTGSSRPPQSFQYLNRARVAHLLPSEPANHAALEVDDR
jgi:predicted transcriptional regulator